MNIYFEVFSALGKKIRVTKGHWDFIVQRKHLEIAGRELDAEEALISPSAVRISKEDDEVFLYYKRLQKLYLCVVCRHLNGDGFIMTCYLTDKIKEGRQVWPK